MLLTTAAVSAFASPESTLTPVPSRDRKVVRRWALPDEPRGVATGADGTIYVGLAAPQAVIAVDPKTGAVKRRHVLDSAEIASTKELVTLRTNPSRTRLFIANGSDESATILSLPDLGVIREITMEGETIRDVLPDPKGRYIYLLGRRVHVFDAEGDTELRTLEIDDPMAIATSSDGAILAVVATEDFGNAKATSVALFSTTGFAELAREPLQTDQRIEAAMFADADRSLLAFSRNSLFEKPVSSRPIRVTQAPAGDASRMKVTLGDLVNSFHVCLPNASGPQIATLTSSDWSLVYAERRCSASSAFAGSNRRVTPASLYNVSAYALAYDRSTNTIVATDPEGFLTIYNIPRPVSVQ